jgi:hypothetical protein
VQARLTPRKGAGERMNPRRLVNRRARLKNEQARESEARVLDLSDRGCRLAPAESLEIEQKLWIELPGLEARAGSVIWSADGEAGCSFDVPLYRGELDLVRAQGARPASAGFGRRLG